MFPFLLTIDELLHLHIVLKWSVVILEFRVINSVVNHGFKRITQILLAFPGKLKHLDNSLISNLTKTYTNIILTTVS